MPASHEMKSIFAHGSFPLGHRAVGLTPLALPRVDAGRHGVTVISPNGRAAAAKGGKNEKSA